ncbi:MAG: WG repeat-containing protein [Oscillospiraceae bacterium]|nr:WG repeat-containing protein [Oscillospiraceae bacterium]
MKKTFLKLLTFLLAFILMSSSLFLLSSCGGDTSGQKGNSISPEPMPPEPDDEPLSYDELRKKAKEDLLLNIFVDGVGCGMIDGKPVLFNEKGEILPAKAELWNKPFMGAISDFDLNGLCLVKDESGKFGWINKEGEYIIEPQFDNASSFDEENLAKVCIGDIETGKWGLINEIGEYVADPQFDSIGNFSNGLAAVSMSGKLGYIGTNGKYVINPQFDEANEFDENGVAQVTIDEEIKYIDEDGEYVSAPESKNNEDELDSDSLSAKQDPESGKWGYVNSFDEFVIKPQFDEAHAFSNGFAAVCYRFENDDPEKFTPDKWGYINESGKLVINPEFSEAGFFNNDGLAIVRIYEKWSDTMYQITDYGIINSEGDFVVEPEYPDIRFAEGFDDNVLAWVGVPTREDTPTYRLIDKNGIYISEYDFYLDFCIPDFITDCPHCDTLPVTRADAFPLDSNESNESPFPKAGFINRRGEMVIEPKFDTLSFRTFNFIYSHGLTSAYTEDGWIVFNTEGKVVIGPKPFRMQLFNDYILTREGMGNGPGKYGLMDLEGNIILEPKFDLIKNPSSRFGGTSI